MENFIADNDRLAVPGTTMDRIDNDGPYSPDNVRWVSRKAQSRNKSNNRIISYNGRSQTLAAWAEEVGMAINALQARLRAGWEVEDALTTPVAPHVAADRTLVDDDVLLIRKRLAEGIFPTAIAKEFGVSRGAIQGIASGRTWKHVA